MSSQISLKVGNTTATLPIGGTDAQIAAALGRYAKGLGIPISGVPVDDLLAVLTHIVDKVRRKSIEVQVYEATVATQAAILAQANSENNL